MESLNGATGRWGNSRDDSKVQIIYYRMIIIIDTSWLMIASAIPNIFNGGVMAGSDTKA